MKTLIHRKILIPSITVLTLLVCSGCSTKPVIVDLAYDESTIINSNKKLESSHCRYVIGDIQDLRKSASLGSLGNISVSGTDVVSWIRNGLDYRYAKQVSVTIPPKVLTITLNHLYIRSSSTSKVSNIVLGVKTENTEKVRYYRGTDATMNWSASELEIKSSFNRALTKAIQQIEEAILQKC